MKQSLIKVLTALRDHGPSNNKRLKELGVSGLTGADNAELVAQGLVTTEKAGRVLVHTLTPAGDDYLKRPAPELLSPTQILALVVLMAEARELSNNEFARAAGFSLTGKDNEALVKRGLVETDKSTRPFVHQLTDKGWKLVRTLHEGEVPKEGRSAIRTLFSLMANVGRALDRLQISHGEFFKQTQTVTAVPQDVEGAIRAAYVALANPPGDWVGLADVRDRLPGVDRAAVDAALRGMLSQPGVRVIPVANLKALQPRDREAAVRIGGEDSHMMAIESS
ncbi:hypothetical protein [Dactylosporangium sp. NPDC049140]|jgi:predicted transcriptional regulator|uniref:hypothetical protein n=1 Tax=Dactylosporangium sp. NPDC049140 TaxID=3155647 RepID=UPI0033CB624C